METIFKSDDTWDLIYAGKKNIQGKANPVIRVSKSWMGVDYEITVVVRKKR
jgi:hypothetical protein